MLLATPPMLRRLAGSLAPGARTLAAAPLMRPVSLPPVRAYQSRSSPPPQAHAFNSQFKNWPQASGPRQGRSEGSARAVRSDGGEAGPVPTNAPYDEGIRAPQVVVPLTVPEGALLGPLPLPPGWVPPEPTPKKTQRETSEESGETEKSEKRASGGKGLSPPIPTGQLLRVVNRKDWWLTQVTLNSPVGFPIVRLVNKADYAEKVRKQEEADAKAEEEKEANKHKVQPDQKLKEIRFTWNISDHDLTHKMERLISQSRQKGHKLSVEIKTSKGKAKEFYLPGALEARQALLYKVDKMVVEDDPGHGFKLEQNQGKTRWQNQTFKTLYEPVGAYRS